MLPPVDQVGDGDGEQKQAGIKKGPVHQPWLDEKLAGIVPHREPRPEARNSSSVGGKCIGKCCSKKALFLEHESRRSAAIPLQI